MADDLYAATDTSPVEVESVIERYDEEPDECTIFRADIPDRQRLSTWISAKEGSYVDLCLCR